MKITELSTNYPYYVIIKFETFIRNFYCPFNEELESCDFNKFETRIAVVVEDCVFKIGKFIFITHYNETHDVYKLINKDYETVIIRIESKIDNDIINFKNSHNCTCDQENIEYDYDYYTGTVISQYSWNILNRIWKWKGYKKILYLIITWTSYDNGKTCHNRALETVDGIVEPFETTEIKPNTGDKYTGRYIPDEKRVLGVTTVESYVDL